MSSLRRLSAALFFAVSACGRGRAFSGPPASLGPEARPLFMERLGLSRRPRIISAGHTFLGPSARVNALTIAEVHGSVGQNDVQGFPMPPQSAALGDPIAWARCAALACAAPAPGDATKRQIDGSRAQGRLGQCCRGACRGGLAFAAPVWLPVPQACRHLVASDASFRRPFTAGVFWRLRLGAGQRLRRRGFGAHVRRRLCG